MGNIKKAIELQRKFCLLHSVPHFAPEDGICYHCGKQIYEKITEMKAASKLITGCPHCDNSFVE
jgi:hypothetical protein